MPETWPVDVSTTLLAYLFRQQAPADEPGFRRAVGLRGPLGAVTAAGFLLYHVPGKPSAYELVVETAPVLLQQLSRTTETRRNLQHGRTRGRVDWSSTYKARYSADSNPTVYVCLESSRRYDRPENQLFRYLLDQVKTCLERLPAAMWEWQAWGPGLRSREAGAPLVVRTRLALFAHRLRVYRAHPALESVPCPAVIETRHLLAARTSKNELYAGLAALYESYQSQVLAPRYPDWLELLEATLPLPPAAQELGALLFPAQEPARRLESRLQPGIGEELAS